MTRGKRLLLIAGCLSLALTLFQIVISFVPLWSLYFGAPAEITANRGLLLASGLVAAVFFAIFGLYGLSGAGLIPRLFLLRLGLVVISGIYILRGLFFIPQLLILSGILTSAEDVVPRWLIYSLVSLTIGLVYAFGIYGAWRELKTHIEV